MPDILIFDDDPDVAALLGEVMRGKGFTVAHYPSADGIIQIVQENRPRLVVLDIMMPGLNGISACRDLRSNMATRHIKIVVITAKQFEQDRIAAQRYGAALFVNKPFNGEQLGQAIVQLLGSPQPAAAPAAPAPPVVVTVLPGGAVVEGAGLWVILDAGCGLGRWMASHAALPRQCWLLLSRYEPSALEELGACAPLLAAGGSVKVAGPDDAETTLPRIAPRISAGLPLHGMKAPRAFPARPEATPLLYPMREGEFALAPGVMGMARYTHHPGSALAYRLDMSGRRLVYCPCNEVRLDASSWNRHELDKFRALFSGVDLLIHGYGRSSEQPRPGDGVNACCWEAVVDMATDARVRQLLLVPLAGASARDVAALARLRVAALHSSMLCSVAAPGETVVL
ncbi:MAG: response regulator [Elusimicrobia bacterium]|nr:response regulator [Elusimicrobiota bacterium]